MKSEIFEIFLQIFHRDNSHYNCVTFLISLFSFVAKNFPANHWNVMNKMNVKSDQQHANMYALDVNGKGHCTKVII